MTKVPSKWSELTSVSSLYRFKVIKAVYLFRIIRQVGVSCVTLMSHKILDLCRGQNKNLLGYMVTKSFITKHDNTSLKTNIHLCNITNITIR